MPTGLKRYQDLDHGHLITFSCFGRRPYLKTSASRDLFEQSLEKIRSRYQFGILAYVVMPEHVHLLVSEPDEKRLSTAMQALKVYVSKQSEQHPFWQPRYHDFNVFTQPKRLERFATSTTTP